MARPLIRWGVAPSDGDIRVDLEHIAAYFAAKADEVVLWDVTARPNPAAPPTTPPLDFDGTAFHVWEGTRVHIFLGEEWRNSSLRRRMYLFRRDWGR
ncbi:MAG: hypothetical protein AVDCRST_MAG68-5429 [uncultured Gemmatimonadetes bacterium]|uniref:Uncharacterized protein n=1 Tax=uncultured Gemmatimonadota bacterium TaxID=203437 RepID=A0A6J4MVB8_9BACT|nr:MAG: hypothetical protein AVDCRST_MAG68-5429 [uncultured Gemmatimonadota bacterium]